jgi:hypothetical protein
MASVFGMNAQEFGQGQLPIIHELKYMRKFTIIYIIIDPEPNRRSPYFIRHHHSNFHPCFQHVDPSALLVRVQIYVQNHACKDWALWRLAKFGYTEPNTI